jgi:hypothetical protein
MEINAGLQQVISRFNLPGVLEECCSYGNGHINDTYRLTFEDGGVDRRYILQKINKRVFPQPEELMENMIGVTSWIKAKVRERGGDEMRETLTVIRTQDGMPYVVDAQGEYWRVCTFIEGTVCYEQVKNENDFYQSALAFGQFQGMLAEYPADTLHEVIRNFHHTPDRLRKFEEALQADVCGRADSVKEEIDFILARRKLAYALYDRLQKGELPVRVTHNDTKLNNILIDEKTGKALCVIDLDTVMPGLSAYDFGDAIRFGASTAAEDEQDLSKVSCDLHLFEAYTKGYLEGCAGALTQTEMDMLPMGAILMTFETGIRFLTDYLEGDHYFKIHREGHNLDRCRTQLALVRDMEEKLLQMNAIVDRYRG